MTKNVRISLCLSLFLLALNACGLNPQRIMSVKPGMSQEQVLALLGPPHAKEIERQQEEWGYDTQYGKPYYIVFESNRVVRLSDTSLKQRRREAMGIFDRPAPPPPQPEKRPNVGDIVRMEWPFPMPQDLPIPGQRPRRSNDYGRGVDEGFEGFFRAFEREAFESEKFKMLQDAAARGYFTCRQCARLMQTFRFESDQMKVLRIMAPALIDPQNSYVITDLYRFPSDKERVRGIINEGLSRSRQGQRPYLVSPYGGGYAQDQEGDFEGFFRAFEQERFDSDKFKFLRDACKYGYFTCRQCARLMKTFRFESDQLEVLRIMAPALVDPQNSHVITEMYRFPSDKERVRSIINTRP